MEFPGEFYLIREVMKNIMLLIRVLSLMLVHMDKSNNYRLKRETQQVTAKRL